MSDRMASREALLEALGLKAVARAGWLRSGIKQPESVAAHSWGMSFIAMQLCPPELNRQRVIEMCIVHDIAEVRIGDITPHDGISPDEKSHLELQAFESMGLTEKSLELFKEYESQSTKESRFVRFVDKLDMALQAEIYEKEGLDLNEFKESAKKLADEFGFEW